jgi:hypothetical protein
MTTARATLVLPCRNLDMNIDAAQQGSEILDTDRGIITGTQ